MENKNNKSLLIVSKSENSESLDVFFDKNITKEELLEIRDMVHYQLVNLMVKENLSDLSEKKYKLVESVLAPKERVGN